MRAGMIFLIGLACGSLGCAQQADAPTDGPAPDTSAVADTAVDTTAEMQADTLSDVVADTIVAPPTCEKTLHFTITADTVWRVADGDAFFFETGMTIDADGAPDAYHPDDIGTDHLANAGQPGNWWGLATDEEGEPFVQGPDDPNPGYYVSTTALEDPARAISDPRRYVNSNTIPFIVLPGGQHGGARLGDIAVVVNTANDSLAYALFADIGPRAHLGEGSIALAKALGIRSDPKRGGTASGVRYLVFPGSGNGRPRPVAEIDAVADPLLVEWGGRDRMAVCFVE